MPRLAMRCLMRRCVQALRHLGKSYPLSPWSFCGCRVGRPCLLRNAGIRSSMGSSILESCTFAAVKDTASGMPFKSVMMWCLLPGRPRSTGLGPVSSPPFLPVRWTRQYRPLTSQSSSHHANAGESQGAAAPIHQPPANHEAAANKSFHSHSPSPAANLPTECLSSARR